MKDIEERLDKSKYIDIYSYNDLYDVIDFNKKDIKFINSFIKDLYKYTDHVVVNNICDKLDELILKNVNYLNSLKNYYKIIPKSFSKDILKKINVIYLGYLQLEKDIQALRDVFSL